MVASHVPPTGDLACNPGMCPRLGIKPATLGFAGQRSICWATTARARFPFNPQIFLFAHPRGSSPTTTLTSGAGQLTSTGKSPAAGEPQFFHSIPALRPPLLSPPWAPVPAFQPLSLVPTALQTSASILLSKSCPVSFHPSGRSPEGALPAGGWPCSARSPCTGGRQTPFSTGSRSCLVRSPGEEQRGGEVSKGRRGRTVRGPWGWVPHSQMAVICQP